jgi:hypothetical protein
MPILEEKPQDRKEADQLAERREILSLLSEIGSGSEKALFLKVHAHHSVKRHN